MIKVGDALRSERRTEMFDTYKAFTFSYTEKYDKFFTLSNVNLRGGVAGRGEEAD